jgi:hypothetical protein
MDLFYSHLAVLRRERDDANLINRRGVRKRRVSSSAARVYCRRLYDGHRQHIEFSK